MIHATMWMNLGNIILSDISLTQRPDCMGFHLKRNVLEQANPYVRGNRLADCCQGLWSREWQLLGWGCGCVLTRTRWREWLHNIENAFSATELEHLNMIKMVNAMFCVFFHKYLTGLHYPAAPAPPRCLPSASSNPWSDEGAEVPPHPGSAEAASTLQQ